MERQNCHMMNPPGSGLRQNLGQGESRGQGVSRGGKQIIILLIMF